MKEPGEVTFEGADSAAYFDCPGCGEQVTVEGKRETFPREVVSPFEDWYEDQIPVECWSCGKVYRASWQHHIDVQVEEDVEDGEDAETVAEGTY